MASSRGNPALGDILRSVLVMGLIILALWGFGQFFTRTPDQPTRSIDYAKTVRDVRAAADYPVLAPPSLPDGWRATSARYNRGNQGWHLGVLSDDDEYVGLEQSKDTVKESLDDFAPGGEGAGSAQVAGTVWQVSVSEDDRLTYVSEKDGVTTLVTTSGDQALLEAYVESLTSE